MAGLSLEERIDSQHIQWPVYKTLQRLGRGKGGGWDARSFGGTWEVHKLTTQNCYHNFQDGSMNLNKDYLHFTLEKNGIHFYYRYLILAVLSTSDENFPHKLFWTQKYQIHTIATQETSEGETTGACVHT